MRSLLSKIALLLYIVPVLVFADYKAEVVRVVDGDTVNLNVHIWPGLTQQISLRLAGVNTPEKRASAECERLAAKKATEFTLWFLEGVESVTVTDVKLGKYAGRVLGKIQVGGVDLGQALIETGHALPYDGGHRGPWCSDPIKPP
ncbi:thermonuclease family protein [Sedimenticola selenatireducens]|uniref:Thermonuclease family protein n=1 Tax=Sedimenticola selenatireducens TaxID=191960 RepID=A0A558E0V6_9GAMM|nr:thermonuclease family protein [Sedimenticola selenatireducens]TVO75151.1 thermonuclease family protein [Sedimenticola selenatireducens]TVT66994.1 MAG: thermonuclease family protein [Sedimenticola selenatireducens]